MTTHPAHDLLTVHQAAEELHISPRAVRHRISVGTLAARKFGTGRTSAYVIDRAEVERAKNPQPTSTPAS